MQLESEDDVEITYKADVHCDNAKKRGVPTPQIKATTFSKPTLQALAASATATAAENQHVIEAGAKLTCRHGVTANACNYFES